MGLVERGPDRMGEVLAFPDLNGEPIAAKIVDPVFYDPGRGKTECLRR